MKTTDFDYNLPVELIGQNPVEPRDSSRLMIIDRSTKTFRHHRFYELVDILRQGDVLVMNNSRVLPARLFGKKTNTGGKVEILLLRRLNRNLWETLVKPGKRVKSGTRLLVTAESQELSGTGASIEAKVIEEGDRGIRLIEFPNEELLLGLGRVALPPYIHAPLTDQERYQTIYADISGSVAAPTAGLHFTPKLIEKIEQKGIQSLFVTLHVGLDTFRPVHEEDPRQHTIHSEFGIVSKDVAQRLSEAVEKGQRIICVGTTSVRIVEAAAQASKHNSVDAFEDWVDLFILPDYQFKVVNTMITNFHLPKSTLLMLVSAFAGRDLIMDAYQEAINKKYSFYSFGDAMLIT